MLRQSKRLRRNSQHIVERFPIGQSLRDLQQRQFPLTAHHRIHIALVQCLARDKTRMPAAKNHRHFRIRVLHQLGDAHRATNHRPGQDRNSQAQRALHFAQHARFPVRRDRGVDDLYVETSFQQRGRQTQHAQWRAQRLTVVRRVKQDDFALG